MKCKSRLGKRVWKKLNADEQRLFNEVFTSIRRVKNLVYPHPLKPTRQQRDAVAHNIAFLIAFDRRCARRAGP